MYRCYFIRNGRIAAGEDLEADSVDEAVLAGRQRLTTHPQAASFSGIEIWCGASILHSDGCYGDGTECTAPIGSPFQTGESTMFPVCRPSVARSLLTTVWAAESKPLPQPSEAQHVTNAETPCFRLVA